MERRVSVRGRQRARYGTGREIRPLAVVDPDDPFHALMDAWFDPATPDARWAVVVGVGADARAALDAEAFGHDLLVVRTGNAAADATLADLSPVLGRLLDDMTPSQRRIARFLLVQSLRQADAAEIIGISRASVSVTAARARIREAGLLLHALRVSWAAGRAMPLTRGDTVPR